MTALVHVAGGENSVNKVWLTMHTVDWLYIFFFISIGENVQCLNVNHQLHVCLLFLLQVFVVLLVKMVEHVLRRMFALVRLAGQESDAKQVSHIVL